MNYHAIQSMHDLYLPSANILWFLLLWALVIVKSISTSNRHWWRLNTTLLWSKVTMGKKGLLIYSAVLAAKYCRFEYIVSRLLIHHAPKIESYVYTSILYHKNTSQLIYGVLSTLCHNLIVLGLFSRSIWALKFLGRKGGESLGRLWNHWHLQFLLC